MTAWAVFRAPKAPSSVAGASRGESGPPPSGWRSSSTSAAGLSKGSAGRPWRTSFLSTMDTEAPPVSPFAGGVVAGVAKRSGVARDSALAKCAVAGVAVPASAESRATPSAAPSFSNASALAAWSALGPCVEIWCSAACADVGSSMPSSCLTLKRRRACCSFPTSRSKACRLPSSSSSASGCESPWFWSCTDSRMCCCSCSSSCPKSSWPMRARAACRLAMGWSKVDRSSASVVWRAAAVDSTSTARCSSASGPS
mmetsp:Transcript_7099/g.19203  ORF Transcript_7099/g.19203 Transcript_7099/m.19203 type:complete len:255 (-) Transcript_7099:535-1299(-)